MAAGRKPDYRVVFVEDNGRGKKTYFKIGAAWKHESGESVGIEINIGLPLVLAPHTKLVLFENKENDGEENGAGEGDASFDQRKF